MKFTAFFYLSDCQQAAPIQQQANTLREKGKIRLMENWELSSCFPLNYLLSSPFSACLTWQQKRLPSLLPAVADNLWQTIWQAADPLLAYWEGSGDIYDATFRQGPTPAKRLDNSHSGFLVKRPLGVFCMFYLVFSRQVAQVTVQGHEACLCLLRDTSPEITIQGPSSCPVFHI